MTSPQYLEEVGHQLQPGFIINVISLQVKRISLPTPFQVSSGVIAKIRETKGLDQRIVVVKERRVNAFVLGRGEFKGSGDIQFFVEDSVGGVLFYFQFKTASSTERIDVGKNCRVHFYRHILIGVRDGRDTSLLFRLRFSILLIMVPTNTPKGYRELISPP